MIPVNHPRTARPLAAPEVVVLPAEIDIASAPQAHLELTRALQQGSPVVIADMSHTQFCDVSGVRVLLTASDTAAACGSELRLVLSSRGVLRIFHVLGADTVLRLYASMDKALADPRSRFDA